jgi:hypothetical protein
MKKFIAVSYIFAVLLLCGCNTEMRIERLSVEVEDDTFYYGCGYNVYEHFFVSVTDSNNKTTVLSSGEYGVTGIDVLNEASLGDQTATISYSVPLGNYNGGQVLTKQVTVKVVKPIIKAGSLTLYTAGNLKKGKSIAENMKAGNFAANISYILDNDSTNTQRGIANSFAEGIWGNTWEVTGYDPSSDIVAGTKVSLVGHYCDMTTDAVGVWVID